ncbi:helix-turn-helix transcriptional regulator [Pararhodobacter oceanensis]|uniref:helix-turn-helix transcriptional regulator n=1 Tax=Pararhodobacter oceanensis TaxID=2172121 RepID=UPI003A8DBD3A
MAALDLLNCDIENKLIQTGAKHQEADDASDQEGRGGPMGNDRQQELMATNAVASLITQTASANFGSAALHFLSSVARFENFGAYYIPDLARPKPTLSFWSGRISDYWFQHDADLILATREAQLVILRQVNEAPDRGVNIERWHPEAGDARNDIYLRNGIVERVALSSREGRSGLRSFFLRSIKDGWLSDAEFTGICEILPIVHGLIGLRQKVVGAERHQMRFDGEVTRLRNFNVPAFADLSRREAAVCDSLIEGKSVAATALDLSVSEATVKTLRARAYRKLNVTSATELMALFIRSQPRA